MNVDMCNVCNDMLCDTKPHQFSPWKYHITLDYSHGHVSVMASPITSNLTGRWMVAHADINENNNALYYWWCMRGLCWWPVDCRLEGAIIRKVFQYHDYPTLAREFQGFRVWGKFVLRKLELTDTPTNLANQVKVGHALDQSRSIQSRGPERAHQNNEPSWRSSRSDRRLSRQFWDD